MYLLVKPSCALENDELESILSILIHEFEIPLLCSKEKEALKKSETMWFMLKNKHEEIIGLASFSNCKEDNLKNVTVKKQYRNKSLCTKMLKEIIKFYCEHKNQLYSPCLTVIKNSKSSKLLKLYSNNGFKVDYHDSTKYYLSLK